MREKLCAFIPARSGSNGLTDKNIQDVEPGLSLLGISVLHAFHFTDNVFVSSDSLGYLNEAEKYSMTSDGVKHKPKLIHRPRALSGDRASTYSALIHALGAMEATGATHVITLQPTHPFRRIKYIKHHLEEFFQLGRQCGAAMAAVDNHLYYETGGEAVPMRPMHRTWDIRPRRQDASHERVWQDTGDFFISQISELPNHADYIWKDGFYVFPCGLTLCDVHNHTDMKLARMLWRKDFIGGVE